MSVSADELKTIFGRALELSDPQVRAEYLAEACGENACLRAEIEDLLAAMERAGEFLNRQSPRDNKTQGFSPNATATFGSDSADVTADVPGKYETVGAILGGKYKLIDTIGEGGMGSVYMAQQTEPVKRAVAVKVIKAGMDSKGVLARFEAERQALAMMDHPNIARVLDAGTTDSGRPYFVMELVKGVPITQFCDDRKLTPKQRLELFIPVCHAIQHAHQKGIIHRDIKPSNVLIALYDDKPVVKVIDFGVAKATGGALTERTLDTGFGGVVGTPQYMSPEQATFNNLDIDTRSDVYALGVLLYELLTGSPPFSKQDLEKNGLFEILRVVREEEPPRPSTRLSTSDARPRLSANRSTEPNKLAGLLRNELDWIVMKALEKDRTRRYESATGFAADVQRYLGGEPVQAHPPSPGYRLRKFVRRNRPQVIAASLVMVALVVGVIGTTWQAVRAERARADETEQRSIAEANERRAKEAEQRALELAEAKRQEAEANLRLARKGNDILSAVFAGLEPTASDIAIGDLSEVMRRNVKKAAAELDGATGDPLILAQMRNTLGLALLGVGEPKLAIDSLQKALATSTTTLGPDHPDTHANKNNLAAAYLRAGLPEAALPLYEQALAQRTATLGPDHADTIAIVSKIAGIYRATGQVDRAVALHEDLLLRRTVKLGALHPDTIQSMVQLGEACQDAGKLDRAGQLFEQVLVIMKSRLGVKNPVTQILETKVNLNRELVKHATRYQQELTAHGPKDINTLLALRDLASTHLAAGSIHQAAKSLTEVLTGMTNRSADDTILAFTITVVRRCLDQHAEAVPQGLTTHSLQSLLGLGLMTQRKFAEAEEWLLKGYEGMKAREKDVPTEAALRIPEALDRLIELYTATKKPDEVKKWRTERAKYPSPGKLPSEKK